MSKGFFIFGLVSGIIGTLCSVVTTVDQVKNGNKRAAITGRACGQQIIDAMPDDIVEDTETGKKFKKGLFGSLIEVH